MTLREYILKKSKWILLIPFLAIMVGGLLFGVVRPFSNPYLAFFLPPIVILLLCWIAIFIPKCPRCKGRLHIMVTGLKSSPFGKRVDYCPFCGVSFDEKMDPKEE